MNNVDPALSRGGVGLAGWSTPGSSNRLEGLLPGAVRAFNGRSLMRLGYSI
jgi:hypothetical protein